MRVKRRARHAEPVTGPREMLSVLTWDSLQVLELVVDHGPLDVPALWRFHTEDGWEYTLNGFRMVILKLEEAGLLERETRLTAQDWTSTSCSVRYRADREAIAYAAAWLSALALREPKAKRR